MSFHIWRKIYYVLGWEYPERYDQRQAHLKFICGEQIKKSKLKLKSINKKKKKKKYKVEIRKVIVTGKN